jgi:hypothetical protein
VKLKHVIGKTIFIISPRAKNDAHFYSRRMQNNKILIRMFVCLVLVYLYGVLESVFRFSCCKWLLKTESRNENCRRHRINHIVFLSGRFQLSYLQTV